MAEPGADADRACSDFDAARENHVLVMTPQLLLNMLEAGAAHFHQIALLCIDECHHAKDSHPTSMILAHYRASARTTQILGLTASPVSKASPDATYAGLLQLKRNLHAEYVVLDERDEELLKVVPQVQQQEVLVPVAAQDASFARRLGGFVLGAVARLGAELGLAGLSAEAEAAARAAETTARLAAADGHDVAGALLLVRACVAALALVHDVGFEAAVRHLSQEYAAVALKLVSADPSLPAGSSAPGSPSRPLTSSLLQQLAQEVEQEGMMSDAFSTEAAALSRHPKFAALREQLLAFRGREAFHGIVFARTREAVRALAKLIGAAPDLQFLEAFAFMGHGRGKAGGGDGGMTSKQQQAAMEAFRAPGRRLLVSTSAAEEGIDVPRCEVVIRFSATQSGRERVQSAGRARKLGSRFVEIVEATPAELALVRKARQEEQNMRAALAGLTSMRIA
ncbi:hypothetical protein ABPG75_001549 [Micractinium tetrahymenae]